MSSIVNLIVGKLEDKPFVMAAVAMIITWSLGIATTVAGTPIGAPSWTQYLPAGVAAVVSAFIHRVYSGHAAASYKVQAENGLLMPNASPVGVGSGPPPGPGHTLPDLKGPESTDAPRGPMPTAQAEPANAARLSQPPQP